MFICIYNKIQKLLREESLLLSVVAWCTVEEEVLVFKP